MSESQCRLTREDIPNRKPDVCGRTGAWIKEADRTSNWKIWFKENVYEENNGTVWKTWTTKRGDEELLCTWAGHFVEEVQDEYCQWLLEQSLLCD